MHECPCILQVLVVPGAHMHVAGGVGSDGDLKTALRYLKRAATLGTESMEVDNLSVTFLNLCAVLSQSGKCVPAASPCGVLRWVCQTIR